MWVAQLMLHRACVSERSRCFAFCYGFLLSTHPRSMALDALSVSYADRLVCSQAYLVNAGLPVPIHSYVHTLQGL